MRDERGRRHRGIVSYGGHPPTTPPADPAKFHIAFLSSPSAIDAAPRATAICVPKLAKSRAIVGPVAPSLGGDGVATMLRNGSLPAPLHAQYQAGRVVTDAGAIDARKVFVPRGGTVDLEHLALVLVDRSRAEAVAPYVALIRRELGLPSAANAWLALETRLDPADPSEKPPARAPAIRRLQSALRRVKGGRLPQEPLETFADDLQFLRLFERAEHALRRDALDRLLADVITDAPVAVRRRSRPATILRLPRRRDA